MKKNKKLLIIGIVILALLLLTVIILIAVSGRKKKQKKNTLFADSDYPCQYWTEKDSLYFSVDGSKTETLPWEVTVRDSEILEAGEPQNGKNGKITVSFRPLVEGMTEISFYKVFSYEDFTFDALTIKIPVIVTRNGENLEVKVLEYASLKDMGGILMASDSELPFVLMNDGSTAMIVYLKERGDWKIERNSVVTEANISYSDKDADYLYDGRGGTIYEFYTTEEGQSKEERTNKATGTDANTDLTETTLHMINEEKGIEAYVNVRFAENGYLYLSGGEKPKGEK